MPIAIQQINGLFGAEETIMPKFRENSDQGDAIANAGNFRSVAKEKDSPA